MDVKQLEYMIKIAEENNITKDRQMFCTQQSV